MSRSVDWLKRQSRDPYVIERVKRGLNSRSAFKLEELDDKLKFIGKNKKTVDLGASPGGWTQILLEKGVRDIVAVDLKELPKNLTVDAGGVKFLLGYFTLKETQEACLKQMGGKPAVSFIIFSCILFLIFDHFSFFHSLKYNTSK